MGGTCGAMVTITINGHGDPSSNLFRNLHNVNTVGKLFSLQHRINSRTDWLFNRGVTTGLEEEKLFIQNS